MKNREQEGWVILVNDEPLFSPMDLFKKKKEAERYLGDFLEDGQDKKDAVKRKECKIVEGKIIWQ